MYYFIGVSSKYPNSYWLTYRRNSDMADIKFLCNERMPEPTINPIFDINRKTSLRRFLKYDFVMTDLVPIVNERLKNVISSLAPDDIQFIKSFVCSNSEVVGEYYIPIFLKVVDCIDWEASSFDKQIEMFKKIVLKENSLATNKVVKAKGDELGLPIVQREIYDKCCDIGIMGCTFYENPYINPLFEI